MHSIHGVPARIGYGEGRHPLRVGTDQPELVMVRAILRSGLERAGQNWLLGAASPLRAGTGKGPGAKHVYIYIYIYI